MRTDRYNALRRRLRLTLPEVSAATGYSLGYVSRWGHSGSSAIEPPAVAIERLADVSVPRRGQLIRVLYSEIGRILSHLLNVTTQAMDVGALTPPLWGFEEPEARS